MAGDWIAWTKGLTRKLEIHRIAAILGISRNDAACACMAVWEWADDNTHNGDAESVTAAHLSVIVGINGIGEAMSEVGWIISTPEGVSFPNWDRYNSKSAKKRLQTRDRMRRQRANAP